MGESSGCEVSVTSARIIEDDLTQRNPDFVRRFDLIRAANILNRGYFEPTHLILRS
jgi:hypothetical protein